VDIFRDAETQLSPTLVSGGLTFASIRARSRVSCAVTSAGVGYCWGANYNGQLGDGTFTLGTSPTPVIGGLTFATISTGGDHTCGLTTANLAYCWGNNGAGQLGDGTNVNRSVPTLVLFNQ